MERPEPEKTFPTIKKSQTTRYDLRNEYPYWWATIIISKDGQINIQSDYGDWSMWWGAFGENFKSFLCRLDRGYIVGKFGGNDKEFNEEKTKLEIKKEIIRARKDDEIDTETARQAWDDMDVLEWYNVNSYQYSWYHGMVDGLDKVFCDPFCIPCVMETEYGLSAFLEKIWPVFIDTLKKELEEDPKEFNRS